MLGEVRLPAREEAVAGVAEALPDQLLLAARHDTDRLPLDLQPLDHFGGLDPAGRFGQRLGFLTERDLSGEILRAGLVLRRKVRFAAGPHDVVRRLETPPQRVALRARHIADLAPLFLQRADLACDLRRDPRARRAPPSSRRAVPERRGWPSAATPSARAVPGPSAVSVVWTFLRRAAISSCSRFDGSGGRSASAARTSRSARSPALSVRSVLPASDSIRAARWVSLASASCRARASRACASARFGLLLRGRACSRAPPPRCVRAAACCEPLLRSRTGRQSSRARASRSRRRAPRCSRARACLRARRAAASGDRVLRDGSVGAPVPRAGDGILRASPMRVRRPDSAGGMGAAVCAALSARGALVHFAQNRPGALDRALVLPARGDLLEIRAIVDPLDRGDTRVFEVAVQGDARGFRRDPAAPSSAARRIGSSWACRAIDPSACASLTRPQRSRARLPREAPSSRSSQASSRRRALRPRARLSAVGDAFKDVERDIAQHRQRRVANVRRSGSASATSRQCGRIHQLGDRRPAHSSVRIVARNLGEQVALVDRDFLYVGQPDDGVGMLLRRLCAKSSSRVITRSGLSVSF